ncbi:uncharacterized protein [Hemitrygon akajei]|uniref:uncharacterized protein n=1 Tax=Hemitrygon akajei TaxID=2704970 RepID=UPI003BF981FE
MTAVHSTPGWLSTAYHGDIPAKNSHSQTQEEMDQSCPQKPKRDALPSIGRNKESDLGTVPWKKPPAHLVKPPPWSAPCLKRGKEHSSGGITPWVGDLSLDSSLGLIPQSRDLFPGHTGSRCCLLCDPSELRSSPSASLNEESNLGGSQGGQAGMGGSAPIMVKASLTRRSGKEDWGRRKPRGKVRSGGKLPPVQSISNLSFSRNFTFSFFQLALRQSQRYRT